MRKFVLLLLAFCFLFVSCDKNPPENNDGAEVSPSPSIEGSIENPSDNNDIIEDIPVVDIPPIVDDPTDEPTIEVPPVIDEPTDEPTIEVPPVIDEPTDESTIEVPPVVDESTDTLPDDKPNKGDGLEQNPSEEEIVITHLSYTGETLIIYKEEALHFDGLKFTVNYSDENKERVDFSEAILTNIDYKLDGEIKELTLTYNSFSVSIPYKVTYRPIIPEVEYKFVDNSGCFTNYELSKISGNKVKLFDVTEVAILLRGDYEIISSNLGVLKCSILYNREIKFINFYLINDTIYCDLVE